MWDTFLRETIETLLGWKGLKIIGAPEEVVIFSEDGTPSEAMLAEIDTARGYSVIDEKLAKDLRLLDGAAVVEEISIPELGEKKQRVVMVTFTLGGRQKRSRWVVVDRKRDALPLRIGRRDLAGFLVQISENPV